MRKPNPETIVVISVASILLVALIIVVHYFPVLHIDLSISRDIQSEGSTVFRKDLIYWAMVAVSWLGDMIPSGVIVVGFATLFWLYKYRKAAVFTLLSPIVVGLNAILKLIINRPRPTSALVNVVFPETNASFPSSHTVFYTVIFGFFVYMMFKATRMPMWLRILIGVFGAVMIVLVSFSRIYLGAHWATDVLGGYIFGGILLLITVKIYNRLGQTKTGL